MDMDRSLPHRDVDLENDESVRCPDDRIATDLLPETFFRRLDLAAIGSVAALTGGLSPIATGLALADWACHLALAPGKQAELAYQAWQIGVALPGYLARSAMDDDAQPCIRPGSKDQRLMHTAWRDPPYRTYVQTFLLAEQWANQACRGVAGVSSHHEQILRFICDQWFDALSPANFWWSNPLVIDETRRTGGQNFLAGFTNWLEDMRRLFGGNPPWGCEEFEVGRDVAATPGKVVFRDELIELIQYAPSTPRVRAEPVLIVPAWIMKYYILDLSPEKSLIRNLVDTGHTVFCISWRNVSAGQSDLGLDDYRRLGLTAALDAISVIVPDQTVHAVGYCLGGTLLALGAASMARLGDQRLRSLTLLAAQIDFTEPGPLRLFIDDSQIAFLEGMMKEQGTLQPQQMAAAFQLLNSGGLVWSRLVQDYLIGHRRPVIDLLAWNADATRLPYRMHSQYLRRLFLNNDLATGRVIVDGRAIAVQDIRVPIFAVGTERDHVAPWRSVHKIHHLTDTDVTFVLADGGHNGGIVSPPGHEQAGFYLAHKTIADPALGADEWLKDAQRRDGSWWPTWIHWLDQLSSPALVPPPTMGAPKSGYRPLEDAPGTYVLQQ